MAETQEAISMGLWDGKHNYGWGCNKCEKTAGRREISPVFGMVTDLQIDIYNLNFSAKSKFILSFEASLSNRYYVSDSSA